MNITILTGGIILFLTVHTGCNNHHHTKTKSADNQEQKEMTTTMLPTAEKFVTSKMRNRLTIELDKSISEVWKIIGDPKKMPTYSAGLNRVETKMDGNNCAEYTCYFKPIEKGETEIIHSAKMLWYAQNKGWASLDNEPNEFGLKQSLSLITLEPKGNKTVLKWSMHFNCDTKKVLQMNTIALNQALNDIGKKLINKFGGRMTENYVEHF